MNELTRWTPPRIPEGHEWWTDRPHRLAARVKADRRRGLVVEVSRWELSPGLHGCLVRRLKPRPPAWRTPVLVAATAVVAASAVIAALVLLVREVWQARQAIATAAVTVLFLLVLLRAATGHRPTCAGLHCPGCKG